ncbi:MAG: ATP-dependent DNA helicase [Clostridia bacterium]|nr:ATP-dependent DNA helicase [Clostridia bacterium]
MRQVRLSVRELVEFTCRGEDIVSGLSALRDMQEGVLGHKARQERLAPPWEAEVPLTLTLPLDEEEELRLSGRMDVFCPGETPVIEEIKLWQGKTPPPEAVPAHRAQAVIYGHMLCLRDSLPRVEVRVVYVDRSGGVLAAFPETMTAEACAAVFDSFREPWLRRRERLKAHADRRDTSLRHLGFPFGAWRPGQRELAARVYTAVRQGLRLFAQMPTGTGKSAATLFPALKAMGEGWTEQIFCLTARTTQRLSPLDTLARLREQPLCLWTLVLDAKDRQCPEKTLCHPDWCPRAKGHFLRDAAALEEMLSREDWTPEVIREVADRHCICPFEFSLSLCELADVVICDYNYALDPVVHIQRVFDKAKPVTLLIDEAHNLPDRVRAMLSGSLDGEALRRMRAAVGREAGRSHPLWKAMGKVVKALETIPGEGEQEGTLPAVPEALMAAVNDLLEAWTDSGRTPLRTEGLAEFMGEVAGFRRAWRGDTPGAVFWQGSRHPRLTVMALDIAAYFAEVTRGKRGTVCFSATLTPLDRMKTLLGGDPEDGCYTGPSSFPPEHLLLLRKRIDTRYSRREAAAPALAEAIETMVRAHPGHYLAYFPSYAFMTRVAELLTVPYVMQTRSMDIAQRAAFLQPFRADAPPCLGLCVLGGVFAEGIDLPGEALDGVAVAGIGLPQVGIERETLRAWFDKNGLDGFLYAYQMPGLQKVAQAVGRVIRTETDRGVALLLDDRYGRRDCVALCPSHWRMEDGDAAEMLAAFWQRTDATTKTEKDG